MFRKVWKTRKNTQDIFFLFAADNDKSNEDRQKEEELLQQIHKLVETRDFLVDDVEFERLRCASVVSLQLARSPLTVCHCRLWMNIKSHCTYKATRYRYVVHMTCSLIENKKKYFHKGKKKFDIYFSCTGSDVTWHKRDQLGTSVTVTNAGKVVSRFSIIHIHVSTKQPH